MFSWLNSLLCIRGYRNLLDPLTGYFFQKQRATPTAGVRTYVQDYTKVTKDHSE